MFTISNEQKKGILQSTLVGLEMELYQMLVILDLDPETYDLTKILELKDSPEPSTENRLYTTYLKFKKTVEKIADL